jgi:hypothetical protein
MKMHDGTNPANTNYNYGIARVDMAAGTVSGTSAALGVNGIIIGVGTGSKFGTSFDVINPNFAANTIFPNISLTPISTGSTGMGAGLHQTATSYTALQILPSTGTLTGGTIAVYGYGKS